MFELQSSSCATKNPSSHELRCAHKRPTLFELSLMEHVAYHWTECPMCITTSISTFSSSVQTSDVEEKTVTP